MPCDIRAADLPRLRRCDKGIEQPADVFVLGDHLDPFLWDQVDLVLGAGVHLGVASLASEALGVGGCYAAPLSRHVKIFSHAPRRLAAEG